MSRPNIMTRLERGDRLLLDGATGSELQRRGVNVSKGVTADGDLGAWSATAIGDAPEIVRAVHEDYLRVGADIVTTNSFWTNRSRLGMVGLAHEMGAYTQKAVELAIEARDRLNPQAYVAGSMAPPSWGEFDIEAEFADQAAVLADAGVDLILLEYVASIAEALPAVRAAIASTDLPVFLGMCEVTQEGLFKSGESPGELARALEDRMPDGIFAMCSEPSALSRILPRRVDAFEYVGCYAELGYGRATQPSKCPETQWHVIEERATPEQFADLPHLIFE